MMETNEDYLTEELNKQRRKLKEISGTLDQQHQLLRLIIQVLFMHITLLVAKIKHFIIF